MPDTTATVGTATIPAAGQTTATASQTTTGATTGDGAPQPLELSHTFTDFADKERTVTYHFRRPSRSQISRTVDGIRKNAMNSLRTLCLDCVVAEEKDRLKADFDAYDGLGSTFGNEILGRMGFGELGK